MKKLTLAVTLFFLTSQAVTAASFSLSGNYRFDANMTSNWDLAPGTLSNMGNTSSYWAHRFLLRPDVLVDDRFSLKSELIFLQDTPNAGRNLTPDSFGAPLDGSATVANGSYFLSVRRAYMEWASDWGIFRAGRMPKSWGLGLLYHAGNDGVDDFHTTVDRVGFQALLGNLGFNVGYEKAAEGWLNNDADDIDVYELSLDYRNPESMFNVGILYSRNVRALSNQTGFSENSHDLSIFSEKRWGNLQLGGEFASQNYEASGNRFGLLGQMLYLPGHWDFGIDLAYASANNSGAFGFHKNYKPFLLLFRNSLSVNGVSGTSSVNRSAGVGVGSAAGNGSGAGAILSKLHLAYGFSKDQYILGTDLGYAQLVEQGSNAGKALGVEWDLHLSQKWYKNFRTDYALGFLFPGSGFGDDAQIAWGTLIRGVLEF